MCAMHHNEMDGTKHFFHIANVLCNAVVVVVIGVVVVVIRCSRSFPPTPHIFVRSHRLHTGLMNMLPGMGTVQEQCN